MWRCPTNEEVGTLSGPDAVTADVRASKVAWDAALCAYDARAGEAAQSNSLESRVNWRNGKSPTRAPWEKQKDSDQSVYAHETVAAFRMCRFDYLPRINFIWNNILLRSRKRQTWGSSWVDERLEAKRAPGAASLAESVWATELVYLTQKWFATKCRSLR
jgi:hypothetical protein